MGILNLTILAEIESGNNPAAIGDNGRARGLYQMHQEAWDDVTRKRKTLNVLTWSWSTGAHHSQASTSYAHMYLAMLVVKYMDTTGKAPTAPQQYALWNLGFTGFQKRNFDLSKCPKSTQRNAAKFLPTPEIQRPKFSKKHAN